MKNKSVFSKIILLVVLSLACILVTFVIALLAGSWNTTIFDFRNLNFANMVPVLIIGGIISCILIGVTVLFVSRAIFLKVRDYLIEINNEGEEKK